MIIVSSFDDLKYKTVLVDQFTTHVLSTLQTA